MRVSGVLCPLVSVAFLTISVSSRAEASFLVNITQSGSDVVATGTGTINTDGLIDLGSGLSAGGGFILPASVVVFFSSAVDVGGSGDNEGFGGTLTGPLLFGTGSSFFLASSGGGDNVGIVVLTANTGAVLVPVDYVSGSALSGNSTWDSTTIADLGLTPGTYIETWGSGATADSFTIDIEGTSTSEPGAICLLGVGGTALVLHRLRKRASRR
jgi:hypothetical protein